MATVGVRSAVNTSQVGWTQHTTATAAVSKNKLASPNCIGRRVVMVRSAYPVIARAHWLHGSSGVDLRRHGCRPKVYSAWRIQPACRIMPDMDDKRTLAISVSLAVLLALYAGAYVATVRPFVTIDAGIFTVEPEYRFGKSFAPWVFWPAHQVDRRLRPDTWTVDEWLPAESWRSPSIRLDE